MGLAAHNRDKKAYLAGMDVLPFLEDFNTDLPIERKQALKNKLAVYLNELLLHDFHSLVQLLYRIDVSEKKLKTVLQENPTEDAGNLLADLIIQRQAEKQALRKSFHFPTDVPEEDRW